VEVPRTPGKHFEDLPGYYFGVTSRSADGEELLT